MVEKPMISDQIIRESVKANYGIDVVSLSLLPLGADINAATYKALALDQTPYFIKIKRGHSSDTSIEILDLLQHAGIKQIIPPIKTRHGTLFQSIDTCTLIVYPFVEGIDGFNRDLKDTQWIELGTALRKVHEVEVPPPMQQKIRREAYSSKWRDLLKSIYPAVEEHLDTDKVGLELQKFMKKNISDIIRLVDRAEHFATILKDSSSDFVLCHSDIHAGNVLLGENAHVYIVDWDEPIMAPKERDLMFIGGGVGNVWNNPNEEALFYQGYGDTKIDATTMSYYRHERIVEDIAIYSQELLLKKGGGEDRLLMYKHFVAMFEPNGVVEIAFKTDANLAL